MSRLGRWFQKDPIVAAEATSSSPVPESGVTEMGMRPDAKTIDASIDQTPSEEMSAESSGQEMPSEDAQEGVRQAEAMTLAWSKTSLAIAYTLWVLP